MRHIWVMNSSRPDSPTPQLVTTSSGLAPVRTKARIATMRVRTMANVSAEGIHLSRTRLIGRITPLETAAFFCCDGDGADMGTSCWESAVYHIRIQ